MQRRSRSRLLALVMLGALGAIAPSARGEFRPIPVVVEGTCPVRLASVQGIPYQCWRYETFAAKGSAWSQSLGFHFGRLHYKQWRQLMQIYGTWHHSRNLGPYQPERDYRLVDFLPPVVQALNHHQFIQETAEPAHQSLPDLRPELTPNSRPTRVVLAANCWGTLYEILRLASQPRPQTFTVFTTAREPIHHLFRRISVPVIGSPQPGDIVLIDYFNPTENREYLHHAALVVDRDVFFEKSGAGDDLPFRLIDGATFKRRWNPNLFRFEFRRPRRSRELQDPGQVFGLRSRWVLNHWPRLGAVPQPLADRVSLNLALAIDDFAQVTYLQMRSVPLLELERGRYTLSPLAYQRF